MSKENVAIVVEGARCFERRDWRRLGTLIADDARMTPLENWPEPGPFVGRTANLREYQRLIESFESTEITITDCNDQDDWVVARYLWVMAGTGSGVPAEITFSGAHRISGGEFVESHFRVDHDAVLEAAGLSE
jgi:hypothetical protein